MGSLNGLQGTRPAAAAVLGISPAAELSLLGSQMHTSNHSVCHPCSNRVSATSRTAVYGPVRTVVWEGRSCEAPPYPDQSTNEIARFGSLKLQIPAISNAPASEKQTPAQSLTGLFTDDDLANRSHGGRLGVEAT